MNPDCVWVARRLGKHAFRVGGGPNRASTEVLHAVACGRPVFGERCHAPARGVPAQKCHGKEMS